MRRPSGFDGGGDPPRGPGPEEEGAPAQPRVPGRAADLLGRFRRPSGGRDTEAAHEDLDSGDPGGARGDDASGNGTDRAEESADLAPTIDLSEVRASRRRPVGAADHGEPADSADSAGSALVAAERRGLRGLARRDVDPVRRAHKDLKVAERRRRASERRERRRFSAEARGRRRIWLIVAGAIGGLLIFVAAGVLTPIMAVEEVRVEGTSAVPAEEVEGALDRFRGVPLALVNEGEVHRALEPFPLIQRYAIERIPPHTLVVRIEERIPVIALERDGGFELYDPAGVLVGRADARPEGVPQGRGGVGDISSTAFSSAAQVLRDIPADLRAQIAQVSATTGQDVTFGLASGVQVIWGEAANTQRKALVLATMIASLGDRPVEVIDVSSTEAPVFR